MKTVAVIPAFDEAETIGDVRDRTRPHVDLVFVVDDGSRDATSALRGNVLRHSRNLGKGAALRTGIRAALAAGAQAIVTLDGDGQHDPGEIPRLLSALEGSYMVIGKRRRSKEMPPLRRLCNGASSALISILSGRRRYDVHSGYRVYRADLFRKMEIRSRRYEVEVELLLKAGRAGLRVVEVPVSTRYGSERSKFGAARDTLRFLKAVVVYRMGLDRWIFRRNAGKWWRISSSVVGFSVHAFWKRFGRFPATGLSDRDWPLRPTRTDLSP